jgi:deoxyribose-phosphate aldolase
MNKYEEVLSKFDFNLQDDDVTAKISTLLNKVSDHCEVDVLRLLYSCLDLTTLNTEDSKNSVWEFVEKVNELEDVHPEMNNVAAVCVYPNFVETVKEALRANVKIAAVAGGFPASQTFMEVKIAEISLAVAEGADEIDVVMKCGEFFDNNFEEVCEEISEMKAACRQARLKVILETGLLKTVSNIKKATVLAMFAGADFVKTSTGKVYPGATPEAVYVMCEAIRDFYQLYHTKVGIKVSGGVRSTYDALLYYTIVKEVLGEEWLTPEYFRIGASNLAKKLLDGIYG